MTRVGLAVACLLASVFFAPAGAGGAVESGEAPPMVLRGAFGAVPGGSVTEPATAYPGVPLDTYIPSAPLQLELPLPLGAVADLRVEATPATGDGAVILSDGALGFEGPDDQGDSIVTATLTTDSGSRMVAAWLLRVPDRPGGTAALFEIVPPAILVSSGRAATTGSPGNGCYAYLCSDIGMLGPIEGVPSLRLEAGETLTVMTADGSGLVGWNGRLHRLPLTGQPPVSAVEYAAPDAAADLPLTGLVPPEQGTWLLELRVDFDRERGHLWHAYRLVVDDDRQEGVRQDVGAG